MRSPRSPLRCQRAWVLFALQGRDCVRDVGLRPPAAFVADADAALSPTRLAGPTPNFRLRTAAATILSGSRRFCSGGSQGPSRSDPRPLASAAGAGRSAGSRRRLFRGRPCMEWCTTTPRRRRRLFLRSGSLEGLTTTTLPTTVCRRPFSLASPERRVAASRRVAPPGVCIREFFASSCPRRRRGWPRF